MRNILHQVRTSVVFAIVVTLLSALAVAFSGSANADTPPPPPAPSCQGIDMTQGSGTCVDQSSAKATDSSSSSSIDRFSTSGKLLLRAEYAVITKAMHRKEHQAKCQWFPWVWNSYRDVNGKLVWIKWNWPTKLCRLGGPTGWRKVDSKDNTGAKKDCWNVAKPPHSTPPPKPVKLSAVILLTSFANYRLGGKASASAGASASVTVKAWCNCSNSSARAAGGGTANGHAASSVSFFVRGLTRIRAYAHAQQVKLLDHMKLKAETKGVAKAKASANATAWAKVSCTSGGGGGSTPPAVSTTQLNDVDAGGTSPNYCATATVPGSDQGQVSMSSKFGSFTAPSSGGTIQYGEADWNVPAGQTQVCATYVAPTEVPSGGTDTITVTVTDNETGLYAQDSSTFKINPPPPPPA